MLAFIVMIIFVIVTFLYNLDKSVPPVSPIPPNHTRKSNKTIKKKVRFNDKVTVFEYNPEESSQTS